MNYKYQFICSGNKCLEELCRFKNKIHKENFEIFSKQYPILKINDLVLNGWVRASRALLESCFWEIENVGLRVAYIYANDLTYDMFIKYLENIFNDSSKYESGPEESYLFGATIVKEISMPNFELLMISDPGISKKNSVIIRVYPR